MDWFLYDRDLRYERVKLLSTIYKNSLVRGESPFTFVTNTHSFIKPNVTRTTSLRFGLDLNILVLCQHDFRDRANTIEKSVMQSTTEVPMGSPRAYFERHSRRILVNSFFVLRISDHTAKRNGINIPCMG